MLSRTHRLDAHVILATSRELGTKHSQELADRVWHIEELDMRYLNFINASVREAKPPAELALEYLAIVKDDPFLPRPLLREGWMGDKAHRLWRTIFSPLFLEESKRE